MKLQNYILESIEVDFDENIPTLDIITQEAINSLADEIDEMYISGGKKEILEWANNERVDEGFLGGAIGFLTGPMIGKIVARALGVREGVLYDLLTSRLVSTALGSAIQKAIK